LPVAFQCIFVLGFRHTDTRVLVHSTAGSLLYGVVAVKVFFVHDSDHPRWTLPLVGGTLFAVLVTLWGTAASGTSRRSGSASDVEVSPLGLDAAVTSQ
jgi:hypothetical protein